MPHHPKPFWKESRKTWYVEIKGKQHNLGPDKKEAFKRYHEIMNDSYAVKPDHVIGKGGGNRGNGGLTLARFTSQYLDWLRDHRSHDTHDVYSRFLGKFASFLPDKTDAGDVSPSDVHSWVRANTPTVEGGGSGKRGGWRSPNTRRLAVTFVKRLYRWGVSGGLLDVNPVAGVERAPYVPQELVLGESFFASVVSRCKYQCDKDLLLFCWHTGARAREVTKLRQGHLQLNQSRVVYTLKTSKGNKRTRVIYLNGQALEVVGRLRVEGADPEAPVFKCPLSGKAWSNKSLCNSFYPRLRRVCGEVVSSGVPGPGSFTLTNVRHTFATRLLKSGVDPITVALLMGHTNPATLATVYQHLVQDPGHLKGALDKVDTLS